MKLVRPGQPGAEKPGILADDGSLRDISSVVPDITGAVLSEYQLNRLRNLEPTTLPEVARDTRLGPPVTGVGKFICIGLNFSDHARETGVEPPSEPVIFMKATSAICGPNDDIVIPKGSQKTDWEVELGVVIGKQARNIDMEQAYSHIAGYLVVNDLSERAFQLEGTGQWVKGKSADTFGPIGPWLVTRDEVPDPHALAMWLEVDGYLYQDGSTKTMIFDIPYLVSYVSRFMSLQPGDIISTGTPPGVGLGQKPEPVYLKSGQTIRLGIENLGIQKQHTIDWSERGVNI